MSVRTEEKTKNRDSYLAHFSEEIYQMAVKKEIDLNDYLRVLLATFCEKATGCGLNKKKVLKFFDRYWAVAEREWKIHNATNHR